MSKIQGETIQVSKQINGETITRPMSKTQFSLLGEGHGWEQVKTTPKEAKETK